MQGKMWDSIHRGMKERKNRKKSKKVITFVQVVVFPLP